MGKYDKYKKIILSANLIKTMITTSIPGSYGQLTTAGPGNEGVDLAEWINEKIDEGVIISPSTPSATNLSFIRDSTSVTVQSDTGTDAVLPIATPTLAGVMSASDKTNLSSLIVLSGVPAGSSHLNTFTGTIIPDNSSIKEALQALETELENASDGNGIYSGSGTIPTTTVATVTDRFSIDIPVTSGIFEVGDYNNVVTNGNHFIRLQTDYGIEMGRSAGFFPRFEMNPFKTEFYGPAEFGFDVFHFNLTQPGYLNTEKIKFNIGSSNGNFQGLVYSNDFSANFVANSLITKQYLEDQLTALPHNDLTGLQGGIAGEYYHLTKAQHDTLFLTAPPNSLVGSDNGGSIKALGVAGSITFSGTNIQLVNDNVSPGNNKYYGTDASGVKGFHDITLLGVSSVSVTDSSDIDFTVTNPTTTPNITGVLTSTGVIAGSYGSSSAVPIYTVDSKGRLTSAGNTSISISSSSVVDFNESVDDRVNTLLVAGTGITLNYDDTANTLTIASSGTVSGTGTANYVAYWNSSSSLTGDIDFQFDGTYLTLGTPTPASLSRFTTKGTGSTVSTFGWTHQNLAGNNVFQVADNGAVTIGALGDVYIHPDQMNISAGGTYVISKSGGDLGLYSDTTVVVEGGGIATTTPSFKSVATRSSNIGTLINAQIQGTFNMVAGSNRYSDLYIDTQVNQSGGTSPIRSIYINPTLTAATNYAGIEINAPGHHALRTTAGKVRFDLGSDAVGDIYYRDANGDLARLPIGGPTEVLGSDGTIPAWTTTAGSLPGGTAGSFLLYSGGSWVSGTYLREIQTGMTGTNVTLASTPLVDTPVQIYKNGLLQNVGDDYTIVGTTLTMVIALVTTDKITAIYYI